VADKKNYKIKVYKNDDENKNRQLYHSEKDVLRKWIAVCSDICEHGDKNTYEKCLVQAFNLTEFVMDNYIEDSFKMHRQNDNLVRIPRKDEKPWDNGIYRFVKQDVVIDFYKLLGAGYGGKTEILEKLGVKLPEGIHEVRKKRNSYAHGTETYKNATREELDSFDTVKYYMNTLGQLLVVLKKLPPEMVDPSYEDMKLQVGSALGYGNKYAVLGLLQENEGTRLFEGRDGKTQRDILIKEILPCPNLLDIYRGSKEHLQKVMSNGIVRIEDVIFKNKACYIVSERIEGTKLYDYIKIHNDDAETKKDLLFQIKKIVNAIGKYTDVCSLFRESDFVVDAGGDLWLTQYEYGKQQYGAEEIIRRYEMILGVQPVIPEKISDSDELKTELETVENEVEVIENEAKEIVPEVIEELAVEETQPNVIEIEPVVEESVANTEVFESVETYEQEEKAKRNVVEYEMEVVETESNPNDWYKLLYTLVACGGVLLILWAISGLLV